MTTSAVQLELQPRELLRKKVGRLRRSGIIPVHLYGPGIESRALQCAGRQLITVLSAAGASSPIAVTIKGESVSHLAFAREIQWDPKRDTVLHVDLLAADVSRPVTAQVSVVLSGESPAAARSVGNVTQLLFAIEVSALPLEMPAQADVDLALMISEDSVVRAGDIPLPAGASLLTDAEEIVARIEMPRAAIGEAGEGGAPAGTEG